MVFRDEYVHPESTTNFASGRRDTVAEIKFNYNNYQNTEATTPFSELKV